MRERERTASPVECKLMTDGEWDRFWSGMDGRSTGEGSPASYYAPSDDEPAPELEDDDDDETCEEDSRPTRPWPIDSAILGHHPLMTQPPMLAKSRGNNRSSRCGVCVGCRARDCGSCKNCLDKPRFGGPGIKKKACLSRICRAAHAREPDSSDQKDSDHEELRQQERAAIDPLGSTEKLDPKDEPNGWPTSPAGQQRLRELLHTQGVTLPLSPAIERATGEPGLSQLPHGYAAPNSPHCHINQLAALHALSDSARRQPLLPLDMRHEMRVLLPNVT